MILRAKYSASFYILPAFSSGRKSVISVENWVDKLIELMFLIIAGVLFALIYNHSVIVKYTKAQEVYTSVNQTLLKR